jgi:hypothetical protein
MRNDERAIAFRLLGHLLAGMLGGAVLVGLLLVLDLGGLATLIRQDEAGLVALALLLFGVCGTFGIGGLAAGLTGLDCGPSAVRRRDRPDGRFAPGLRPRVIPGPFSAARERRPRSISSFVR